MTHIPFLTRHMQAVKNEISQAGCVPAQMLIHKG
jgi:hypothetical protein